MTGKNRRDSRAGSKEGKFDHDNLFEIKKYLRKRHGIKASRILIDHTVKFTRKKYTILGSMSHLEISNVVKKYLVHTPDIIITGDKDKIDIIIELDGKSHESGKVREKDKRRNMHYTRAGIKLIIINTAWLRKIKVNWKEYLDEMMMSNAGN